MSGFNDHKIQRRVLQLSLVLGDFVLLYFCFLLAYYLRFDKLDLLIFQSRTFLAIFLIVGVCNYIFELYEPEHWRSRLFSPNKIILAVLVALASVSILTYVFSVVGSGLLGRGALAIAMFLYLACSNLFRFLIERSNIRNTSKSQWLIICGNSNYSQLQKELNRNRFNGQFSWVNMDEINNDFEIVKNKLGQDWSGIVVDTQMSNELSNILMDVRLKGLRIYSFQQFFEIFWTKIPVFALDSSWFTFCEGFLILQSQVNTKIKRLFDIFVSLVIFVLTIPLMILAMIAIKLESKGPAIFKQIRVGEGGNVFTIYKFRSMSVDAEKSGAQWAKENDSRVTLVGRFIRKTRIDELPQLFNVIKGEMSFIGPRPERPEFTTQLRKKIPYYDLRHLIKPGLSGWAQVMYPYGATEEDAIEKLQYELFYIKNYSFMLDVNIFLKTISIVLFGKGR